MSARTAGWLAWSALGLSAGLLAAALALGGARVAVWAVAMAAYAAVGALVAARRPEHPVGWLFCAMGLANAASAAAVSYAQAGAPNAPPWVTGALWVPLNLWNVSFGLVPLLLLLFPTGTFLSGRWRLLAWPILASVIIGLLTTGSARDALPGSEAFWAGLLGPELGGRVVRAGRSLSGSLMLAGFVVGAVGLIVRLRRSRGVERQQLKWIAYAGSALALVFVGTAVLFFSPLGRVVDPHATNPASLFGGLLFALALAAIPVAAGIAILRYRLYDIDLVIRRTLVYASLTAGLGLVYWGGVLLLQGLLRPFTAGSDLAIVGSTLAVATLFQPLRRRIQDLVDRRFYRSKYDAQQTLEQFGVRLRHQVELDGLSAELVEVVRQTVQPASVSLWLRPPALARQRGDAHG